MWYRAVFLVWGVACSSGSASVVVEGAPEGFAAAWEAESAYWVPLAEPFKAWGLYMDTGRLEFAGDGFEYTTLRIEESGRRCRDARQAQRLSAALINAADGEMDISRYCNAVTDFVDGMLTLEGGEPGRAVYADPVSVQGGVEGEQVASATLAWTRGSRGLFEAWDADACAFGAVTSTLEGESLRTREATLNLRSVGRRIIGQLTAELDTEAGGRLEVDFSAKRCSLGSEPLVFVVQQKR